MRLNKKGLGLMLFLLIHISWDIISGVIWIYALLFYDGIFKIDINSFNEGWPEVMMFAILSILGTLLLYYIVKGERIGGDTINN